MTFELAPSSIFELPLLMTFMLAPSMTSKLTPSMISLLWLFELALMSIETPELAEIFFVLP
ncbi:hypothetical protein TorRG33x02_003140 [Trema orientale]|uniref:Uncharacterized protein n=1 Tax=Trema orientale TaxID=63057 RepID=A0A2P5G1T4_TREOI|nr:hypothetical protein TorRG33x02_003140 [Trema orientale]